MHHRLRYLSLAATTLLLAVTSPLLPLTSHFAPLPAQAQTTQDRNAEAERLFRNGVRQFNKSQFREALESFQQALDIFRKLGERPAEGTILNYMGLVYKFLGQHTKALECLQQGLAIHQQVGNTVEAVVTLGNIGSVYQSMGQYAKALEFFQQGLTIAKAIGHKGEVGYALGNIGFAYQNLGQYAEALGFYQQALAIHKQVRNKAAEGVTLDDIGEVYQSLGQYAKALEFYQQALAIHKRVRNKAAEGETLDDMGEVYQSLGQYAKALEFYQQALAVAKQVGNKAAEGYSLDNIGQVHQSLGQYAKALEYYQRALAILKQVGDKAGEGAILSNIGFLLEIQNQPELAIVFYKQSVNIRETIRQELRVLPREQQQSYTQTVAETYRSLADLLLKQDRVLEAQKVLDLLKLQELEDYLRQVRSNEQTATGVPTLPLEEQFNQGYEAMVDKVMALGKELTQLESIPEQNRTPTQQQRIIQLRKQEQQILSEFNSFIRSPAVETIVTRLSQKAKQWNIDLEELNSLRDNLRNLQQNAVLLNPLILDDRLELVLVTADSPPIHRTASVKREDLNRAIAQFRTALENPNSDAKTPARQLYDWLIKPIENDLTQANAQTIIYAPDGQLRYIPLAALHDGNQWLVQRFRVNNITARTLTDFNTKPQPQLRVLAGAFTKGSYNFNIGNQQFSFNGLPFAGAEVENLATALPGTTKLLDTAFSREGTVPRMNDYNIVHLATHAAFVTGKPEDSFVLFGNGDRATLRDVENWSLPNVDLVVLSACETGVGGQFGNGEEILGFGYQMQRTGAKAAIASLWSVSDGGTQALMDTFYAALQTDKMTKTEALRQAQIALITGDYHALGEQRGLTVQQRINNSLPKTVTTRLSHPNYWAPFILIGNGL